MGMLNFTSSRLPLDGDFPIFQFYQKEVFRIQKKSPKFLTWEILQTPSNCTYSSFFASISFL